MDEGAFLQRLINGGTNLQSIISDITKKSTQFQILHFLLPFGITLTYFFLISPTELSESLVTISLMVTFFGTILMLVNPVERVLFWYTTKKSGEIDKILTSADPKLEIQIEADVGRKYDRFMIHSAPPSELMEEYYKEQERKYEEEWFEPEGDITTGDIELEIKNEVEKAKRKKWFDLKTTLKSNYFYSIYLEKDRFNIVILVYSVIWFLCNSLYFALLTLPNVPVALNLENIMNSEFMIPFVGFSSMLILVFLSSVKIVYLRKKLPMIFNLVELFYQSMDDPYLSHGTDFNEIHRFIQIGDWETVAKLLKVKDSGKKFRRVSERDFLLKLNKLISLQEELINIEKQRLEVEKKQLNSGGGG